MFDDHCVLDFLGRELINALQYIQLPKEMRQRHVDLDTECLERGGTSAAHRGVLADFLNTTIESYPVYLCHACHNDKCSNPMHLYWGTARDNANDRWQRFHDTQGLGRDIEKAGKEAVLAKRLQPDQVKSIREMIRSGLNQSHIAVTHGVNIDRISNIARGLTYKEMK